MKSTKELSVEELQERLNDPELSDVVKTHIEKRLKFLIGDSK